MMAKHNYVLFIIAALAAILPAFIFGNTGHDSHIHGLWAHHFPNSHELNAGFGSSAYFFYPPLSLYITSIFAPLGNLTDFYFAPVAISAFLALLASGITAHWWLKDKTLAILYMLMPAHLLVDFYIGGNLAQIWAYAWLPLIIAGISRQNVPQAAIGTALLLLTNIPVAIILLPAAAIYALAKLPPQSYPRMTLAGLAGIGIAAFYLLPLMAYRKFSTIDLHWREGAGKVFNGNFLDNLTEPYQAIVLLTFAITFFFAAISICKMPKGRERGAIAAICIIATFLMFSPSAFIWENIFPLQVVQFPRRLLVVLSVFAILAASHSNNKRIAIIIAFASLLLTGVFVAKTEFKHSTNAAISFKYGVESFPTYFPSEKAAAQFYPLTEKIIDYPQMQTSIWEENYIEANVKGGQEIRLHRFWFPGWRAWFNGQEVAVYKSGELDLLTVKLPEGEGKLELRHEKLPLQWLGGLITLFCLLLIAAFACYQRPCKDTR